MQVSASVSSSVVQEEENPIHTQTVTPVSEKVDLPGVLVYLSGFPGESTMLYDTGDYVISENLWQIIRKNRDPEYKGFLLFDNEWFWFFEDGKFQKMSSRSVKDVRDHFCPVWPKLKVTFRFSV